MDILTNRKYYKYVFFLAIFLNTLALPFFGIKHNYLYALIIPWGMIILAVDIFKGNFVWKGNGLCYLLGFLSCLAIATWMNQEYSTFHSYVILILQGLIFLLIFTQPKNATLYSIKEEMRSLSLFVSVLVFCSSLISLLMFLFNITITHNATTIGLLGNRLFGIYFNSNPASFLACIVIAFALIAIRNNALYRPFYIVNIFVQLLYVILSNCRNALLILLAMLIALLYYGLFKRREYNRIQKMAAIFVTIIAFYFGSGIVKKGLFLIPEIQGAVFKDESRFHLSDIKELVTLFQEDPWGNRKKIFTIADDISSSRLELWYESYQVWRVSPFIGIGVDNFHQMGMDKFPKSQVLHQPQVVHTHNIFMEALVTSGVVGFVFFLIFTGKSVMVMLENLRRYNHTSSYFFILITCLILLSETLGGMLDYGVFYVYSLSAVLFWNYLGYFYWINNKPRMKLKNDSQFYDVMKYELDEIRYVRETGEMIDEVKLSILDSELNEDEDVYMMRIAIMIPSNLHKTSYFIYCAYYKLLKHVHDESEIDAYEKEMALDLYEMVMDSLTSVLDDGRDIALPPSHKVVLKET